MTLLKAISDKIAADIEAGNLKFPEGCTIICATSNTSRRWQRSDIELGQVFVRDEEKFRVIGIADEPTVIMENTETGERENHVISSRNFSEFRKVE